MSDTKTPSSTAELPNCRPYLISPRIFDPVVFSDQLAAALDAQGSTDNPESRINCAQVWMPGSDADVVKQALDVLRPVCHQRDVALLVCDHAYLVAETGIDGVHLGTRPESDEDISDVKAARKALGDDALIGASCYTSRHRALEAAEKSADYVSFGPCFAGSDTTYDEYLSLDLLSWWNAYIEVPAVAVAGITPENCGELVKAGVDFLAVSGAVWNHPEGPAKAVSAFYDAIAAARHD